MIKTELSNFIKNQALSLGFESCGIARATRIPESEIAHFHSWLDNKRHAGMEYMTKHSEKRYDPRLLVEGCRSLIVVALNYEPKERQNSEAPRIAKFAYGQDYHKLIRTKLRLLLQKINGQESNIHGRAFTDSAPIAERYWATQAGLGWIGKSHHLIIPGKGSAFLIGELLVDIDLVYDTPMPNHCGNCRRCLDACPTKAIDETLGIDANICLSYLTIEKRGPFNPKEASLISKNYNLFGCDSCQDACPWNRFSSKNDCPELQPKKDFLETKREDFKKMSEVEFKNLFAGTCLERTGYKGFTRNLSVL
jgi:epoxyqueuosine reductase